MFTYLRKRVSRSIALLMAVTFLVGVLPSPAQIMPPGPGHTMPPPGAPGNPMAPSAPPAAESPAAASPAPTVSESGGEKLISLNFRDAPLDQVLQFYAEITGRTLIKSPGINATITLRGQTRLTQSEAMQAIDSVLAMNNVVLVPMGTKFFKVVQPTTARQEAMPISSQLPEKPFPENDSLISQIVTLKYIEIAEAQGIIQSFLHGYGKIQPLERTNSLLITDTAGNLQRIMEILEYLDQPAETKVETRIYELKYAEAAKIAGRLNELIADAQGKDEKPRVATAAAAVPAAPPGVIRPRAANAAADQAQSQSEAETALAERGIVQGKVKIIADDRTNIMIVISRPSNFAFFDKIVAILDRPVEPEIIVRVVALEYAKAEEISSILNEFIGAAKAESKTAAATGQAQQAAESSKPGGPATTTSAPDQQRSQALQDYIARRAVESGPQAAQQEKTRIGQLSPNTKILADKRTNSLLLMGTKGDVAALVDIIDRLDTMLAQVLIEAVILEVNLTKSLEYGVDWLQRSMTAYTDSKAGANGGVTVREPLFSYGGGQVNGSGQTFIDGNAVTRSTSLSPNLTYYATFYDLNLDIVLKMVAGSSNARILSTPIVMTTDNTEAKIIVGEQRPVVTSTSTSTAGQQTSSYEYRNIGINLTVTPRINPQRFVVMEITQTADNVGDLVQIDGNDVPVITKREMQASIAVANRQSIVLGGLVSNTKRKSRSKVPILGDIPLLGTLFRSDSRNDSRTELLVLLTPYVLMTPEETQRETERVHAATQASQAPWYRGWSDSPLTKLSPQQIREQKKAEEAVREQQRIAGKGLGRDSLFETKLRDKSKAEDVSASPRVTVVSPAEERDAAEARQQNEEAVAVPVTAPDTDVPASEPTSESNLVPAGVAEPVYPAPAATPAPAAPASAQTAPPPPVDSTLGQQPAPAVSSQEEPAAAPVDADDVNAPVPLQ